MKNESIEQETILTHEGYLRNAINHCLREIELVRELSRRQNMLLNGVTADLEKACHKALNEIEGCDTRMTRAEWTEHLKKMGLKPSC